MPWFFTVSLQILDEIKKTESMLKICLNVGETMKGVRVERNGSAEKQILSPQCFPELDVTIANLYMLKSMEERKTKLYYRLFQNAKSAVFWSGMLVN